MASDLRFVANGTDYHIRSSGSATYTGSGTPWTVKSTSPFQLAMNDVTGPRWTPRPVAPARLFGPGPNNAVLVPIDLTYDDLTEMVMPLQIRASTKELCGDAKQILMRALDTYASVLPAQLRVQGDGVTAPAYYEILGAVWEDNPASTFGEEAESTLLRGQLRLTVRSFLGRDGTSDTGDALMTSVTMGNQPGGTDNVSSLGSTGTGDLAIEGQPMNVQVAPANTNGRFYIASIYEQSEDTTGYSLTATSTWPTFTTVGTATFNVASLLTHPTLSARLIVRVAAIAVSAHYFRAQLALGGGSTYHTVDTPVSLAVTASGVLIDFGEIPIPAIPHTGHSTTTLNLDVTIQGARTADVGGTESATIGYIELLMYYEFCVVSGVNLTSADVLHLVSYPTQSGRTLLPLPTPQARQVTSNQARRRLILEGDVPRYRRGTSLWLAMTADAYGGVHSTTDTASVSAQTAPLWRAWRAD